MRIGIGDVLTKAIDFAAAESWLFDDALPFWSSAGLNPAGGFFEYLDLEARPVDPGYTRTRVQARQVYVFSHAESIGFEAARPAADHGFALLVKAAWLGPGKGWARRINASGAVVDATPDLYDIAFVLLALAWRYRATRDGTCLDLAHQTLDFVDGHMRHPAGGFHNALEPKSGPRHQNPHMHLLEAAQALYEASPDDRYAALAGELAELFTTRFFDPKSGTLAEFFEPDWRRAAGEAGRITEPGHQFEWGWILAHHQRLFGRSDLSGIILRLIETATERGVDPATGLAYDSVRDDGTILSASSRFWPQTERLKAELARAEFLGETRPDAISRVVANIFDRYLSRVPRGTWNEQFDRDGKLSADRIPSSSLYHVSLALFELLRLKPILLQGTA